MNVIERGFDTIDPRLSVKLRRLKLRLRRDRLCDVVHRFAEPSQTVVDIGANRGVYTWMMSHQVGSSGRVHSIEPFPANIRRLSALSTSRPNITVHPIALSDSDGVATLRVPRHHHRQLDAFGSLRPDFGFDSVPVQVEARTLDHVMGPDAHRTAFIKCDVEGHEDAVVEGGWRTITEHRPVMVIEIEQRHRATPVAELVERIIGAGYKCFYLDEYGTHPFARFDLDRDQLHYLSNEFVPNAMPRGYVNNFLFLPISR